MQIEGIEILCDEDIQVVMVQIFSRVSDELAFGFSAIPLFKETLNEDVAFFKKGFKLQGIVAARLYIVGLLLGSHRSQKEIAKQCNVCSGTLKKYYKKLKQEGLGAI